MSKKIDYKDVEGLSYEDAYKELLALVESLESNEHPLDETMILFERCQVLSQHCASLLEKAELKIRQLTGDQIDGVDE
jgi:exodeoxyribonuclease VII small subunit